MEKYPLQEDLKSLEKQKMPAVPGLLPVMNLVLKVFRCKSDDRVKVTKQQIPGYKGEKISIYIIEPREAEQELPCFVFFHGGGFMLKASGAHYQLAKEYAAKTPCKVIYADYRLVPKYAFPVPVEDCFAAYEWTVSHAKELNIDENRIVIGGDSAGGNLAAAVTLMARDRGLTMPCYEILIYPVTDRRMLTQSMKDYTDTPVWDARLSELMWKLYLGEQKPEHMEYASPVEAASLAGFPRTYMEVAEFDSLRDEGIEFCDRLQEEGIPVEFHEIRNACHGFETAADSSVTRVCMERRIDRLKKV